MSCFKYESISLLFTNIYGVETIYWSKKDWTKGMLFTNVLWCRNDRVGEIETKQNLFPNYGVKDLG